MSLKQWASNGWLKAHQTSPKDADELIEFTRELRADVRDWLQENHIELLLPQENK